MEPYTDARLAVAMHPASGSSMVPGMPPGMQLGMQQGVLPGLPMGMQGMAPGMQAGMPHTCKGAYTYTWKN